MSFHMNTAFDKADTGCKPCKPPIPRSDTFMRSQATPTVFFADLPTMIFRRDYARVLRPQRSPQDFLNIDLKTPRLNDIHQHLWLAGLPGAARPLHRQKRLGRDLFITEDPDEHLVWVGTRLFIKPLPLYLFDYDYWQEHICPDESLYQSARGFLLSYAWLICYESDFNIAKDTGLLPKDVDWPGWIQFMDVFLDNIDFPTLDNINKRYHYGELRLTRLNAIYRFMPPSYSLRNLIRGYRSESTWYAAYFGHHFRWLLAVFAIFSVALSALQVGLATSALQNDRNFENASYGFVVAALVSIVACVSVPFFIWFLLFWYHLLSAFLTNKKQRLQGGRGVAVA
ncbi:hypothetical protein IQ06DRAFT_264841 [Phaeosphaeriaceae sp. SRC1lsM3a]|nr:hypothetical protein IQ06DRAFT_264841 [Stagonospora sp. SRC1lsM3a]